MATQYDTVKAFIAWMGSNWPTFSSGAENIASYVNTATNPPTLLNPTGGDPIVELILGEVMGGYFATSVYSNLSLTNAQVKELWADWYNRLLEISTLYSNMTTALNTYITALPS